MKFIKVSDYWDGKTEYVNVEGITNVIPYVEIVEDKGEVWGTEIWMNATSKPTFVRENAEEVMLLITGERFDKVL